uniref:Uncharacterized protein n=2 Tax=Opuntia streptacantha TaxID=393608 RepID=A0A7C9CM57_OPUST
MFTSLRQKSRQLCMGLGTRNKSIIKEKGQHTRVELAANAKGEANSTRNSTGLLGVRTTLNYRRYLLQMLQSGWISRGERIGRGLSVLHLHILRHFSGIKLKLTNPKRFRRLGFALGSRSVSLASRSELSR